MGFLGSALGSGLGALAGGLFGKGKEGAGIGHDIGGWLPFSKGGKPSLALKQRKAKVVKAKKEVKAASVQLKKKVVKLKKAIRGC